MALEELQKLAGSGPEVGEWKTNDIGVGDGRDEGVVRGTRCAAQQMKSGGRGPLVLSGYVQGKPYYLYKDGTAPPPSKAGREALEAAGRRAMARGAARQQADCQAGGQDGAGVEPRGPLAQASAGAAPGQLPCSLRVGSPPGSPPDLLAGAARGSTCAACGT